jgi:hypothetical protein
VQPPFAATAVICMAAWTDLSRAALSGLETVPHAMLLAFGAHAYLRELYAERRHSLWWFAAAALVRISSVGSLVFVCAFELVLRALDRRPSPRAFVRWAGAPLASFALYFAWRFHYYELPLPTTYYAKSLIATVSPDRGATYLWDATRDLGALPILAFGVVALARAFERRRAFLMCMVMFEAACVARVGGDWMPFNRFCIAFAAPLVVLFAVGLAELWTAVAASSRIDRIAAIGLGVASVAWPVVHADAHRADTPVERAKLDTAAYVRHHTQQELYAMRDFFGAMIRRPGEVLATDYGGVLGYYTDASIIEMWGLCNRDIALLGTADGINPIYGKTCIECYRRFDPDYFHVMVPMARAPDAFSTHEAVVDQIFQGRELEPVLRLRTRYATGRVSSADGTRALFFVEKRRPGIALVPRVPPGGLSGAYPFEPRGLAAP